MACVYFLEFPNGKLYTGVAENAALRWKGHRLTAESGKGYAVHKAIRKYGWSKVAKIIFIEGEFDDMLALEEFCIGFFSTQNPFGYNLTQGGDGGTGHILSFAARLEISKRMKGNTHTLGKKFSKEELAQRKKWKHSESTKSKISAALKGIKRTEEQKTNAKVAAVARWADPKQRANAARIAVARCARPGMKLRMSELGKLIVHTEAQKVQHAKEMKQYHSERRAGLHTLTLGEWFKRLRADDKYELRKSA